jgi:cell wall-associated NlpC family hydrolase
MRRLTLALLVVFLAAGLALSVALFAASASSGSMRAASGPATGEDVVKVARRHLDTKYRHGTCTKRAMSCTCLTKKVFSRFGHKLPMSEVGQWKYDRGKVAKSDLRPGDIVFFKERGRNKPITHIGIYSGNGYLVHASNYFGKVVESKMKYLRGYFGAKRIKPR